MATLNITYNGISADYPFGLDERVSDADVRRIAVEAIRSGSVPGLQIGHLNAAAFSNYLIDRLGGPHGNTRIYLRPKVPFG